MQIKGHSEEKVKRLNEGLWQWNQFESEAWAHAAPMDPVALMVLREALMPSEWPGQDIAKKLQSSGIILVLSLCSKGVWERITENLHFPLSHFCNSLPVSLSHFWFLLLLSSVFLQCGVGRRTSSNCCLDFKYTKEIMQQDLKQGK